MAPINKTIALDVALLGTGAGEASYVGDADGVVVELSGTFVATCHVESSIDGVDWKDEGSVSAEGRINVTAGSLYARTNVTAWTSGQVEASAVGSPRLAAPSHALTGIPADDGDSDPIYVGDLDGIIVELDIGGSDATVKVQSSETGAVWVDESSGLTGTARVSIDTNPTANYVRLNVAGGSTGQPTAVATGRAREKQGMLPATASDPATFAGVKAALAAADSDVAFNAQKLTGVADPAAAQDAATKAYVDAAVVPAAAGPFPAGMDVFTGPAAGNTAFRVYGKDFAVTGPGTGITDIKIDGTSIYTGGGSLLVTNDTRIDALTPARTAGTYLVTVEYVIYGSVPVGYFTFT